MCLCRIRLSNADWHGPVATGDDADAHAASKKRPVSAISATASTTGMDEMPTWIRELIVGPCTKLTPVAEVKAPPAASRTGDAVLRASFRVENAPR